MRLSIIKQIIKDTKGLEITVGHWTWTNGNAILSDRTFSPSDTMTDGKLSKGKIKKFEISCFSNT